MANKRWLATAVFKRGNRNRDDIYCYTVDISRQEAKNFKTSKQTIAKRLREASRYWHKKDLKKKNIGRLVAVELSYDSFASFELLARLYKIARND